VLTYWKYAPRAKLAAALLDEPFDRLRACFFEQPRCLRHPIVSVGVFALEKIIIQHSLVRNWIVLHWCELLF
jgi:hypothetical protein